MNSILGDTRANYAKIDSMIEKYYSSIQDNSELPDIIVLPEVWTSGWDCSIFQNCIDSFNETEDFLSKIARKHYVNIIGGSYLRGLKALLKTLARFLTEKANFFKDTIKFTYMLLMAKQKP